MTPTARLLAAVEDGPVTAYLACRAFPVGFAHAINASNGDVNAAISLIEAMLPECAEVAVGFDRHGPMAEMAHPLGDHLPTISERSDTCARALLIALLRALVAKEGA